MTRRGKPISGRKLRVKFWTLAGRSIRSNSVFRMKCLKEETVWFVRVELEFSGELVRSLGISWSKKDKKYSHVISQKRELDLHVLIVMSFESFIVYHPCLLSLLCVSLSLYNIKSSCISSAMGFLFSSRLSRSLNRLRILWVLGRVSSDDPSDFWSCLILVAFVRMIKVLFCVFRRFSGILGKIAGCMTYFLSEHSSDGDVFECL